MGLPAPQMNFFDAAIRPDHDSENNIAFNTRRLGLKWELWFDFLQQRLGRY